MIYNLLQPIKMATEKQIRFNSDLHSICSMDNWNWVRLHSSLLQAKGQSRAQHETRKYEKMYKVIQG
jgi:hypothetical protein